MAQVKVAQVKMLQVKMARVTRKRFSEKPIVALTNSTICILDFYIQFWPLVPGMDFEKSSYSQLPGSLSPDYKYLHVRQIPQQLSFSSQTIPDCIRYIIGVFCYNFKSQMNILASYKHTCVKAEI